MRILIASILFWVFAFVILWGMGGYSFSLKILSKIFKSRQLKKDYSIKPTVTVMIVAHNEEKVILDKLNNVIDNDYPKDKIDYIIASDFCTDATDDIVEAFISEHPEIKMSIHKSVEHKGKTNAQNETQKYTTGEILVMTDANPMFEKNSISELVACFTEDNISYVTGRLVYVNSDTNKTASAETTYWEGDLVQREIESRIYTITAGNGALYACRNKEYYDFEPIKCHDSAMPIFFARKKKRAIYNSAALAYEKAGEVIEDELKRKIRMNRGILFTIIKSIPLLNVFKYGWFSYFYFGHRLCRYLLWLSHIIVFVLSAVLACSHYIYLIAFIGQLLFYILGLLNLKIKSKNKLLTMISYYCMTIYAQCAAAYKCAAGKSKPTWDKAESTR